MFTINPNQIYALPNNLFQRSGDEITAQALTSLVATVSQYLEGAEQQSLPTRIQYHVGFDATYRLKKILLQGLKVIHDKFISPNTDNSEKKMIALKLAERVQECSAGFHNGVNSIIQGFYSPQTIDALLYLMRRNIVGQAASVLTNEVHANNRCFIVANVHGYGVEPLNKDDTYLGNVSDQKIAKTLKLIFEKKLRLFSTLQGLEDQLRGQLYNLGYNGPKESGYTAREYENVKNYLERLFGEVVQTQPNEASGVWYHLLFTLTDAGITDINWPNIRQLIWQAVKKKNYFSYTKPEANALDILMNPACSTEVFEAQVLNNFKNYAFIDAIQALNYFSLPSSLAVPILCGYFDGAPENIQYALFKSLFYSLDEISVKNAILKLQYPTIKENLKQNMDILTFMLPLMSVEDRTTFFLDNTLEVNPLPYVLIKHSVYTQELIRSLTPLKSHVKLHVLKTLIQSNEVPDHTKLASIMAILAQTDEIGRNVLMCIAVDDSNLEPMEMILDYLPTNSKHEKLQELLMQVDDNGMNALMLAATYNTGNLPLIIRFLSLLPKQVLVELVKSILRDKLVSYANKLNITSAFVAGTALHDMEKLQLIHYLLKGTEAHNGMNALMHAIVYDAAKVPLILEFMAKLPNSLKARVVEYVLTRRDKEEHGWSALMQMVVYMPDKIQSMLGVIKTLPEEARNAMIKVVFTQKDGHAFNALMNAATFNYASISVLMDAIETLRHDAVLKDEIIKTLLTQTNGKGMNALMLAAQYNIRGIEPIRVLLTKLSSALQLDVLKHILEQRNVKGMSARMIAAEHPGNVSTDWLMNVRVPTATPTCSLAAIRTLFCAPLPTQDLLNKRPRPKEQLPLDESKRIKLDLNGGEENQHNARTSP